MLVYWFIFVLFALQGLFDVQNSIFDARQVKNVVEACRHASLAESKVVTNQCWYKGKLSRLT